VDAPLVEGCRKTRTRVIQNLIIVSLINPNPEYPACQCPHFSLNFTDTAVNLYIPVFIGFYRMNILILIFFRETLKAEPVLSPRVRSDFFLKKRPYIFCRSFSRFLRSAGPEKRCLTTSI